MEHRVALLNFPCSTADAARSIGRTARERGDIGRASERADTVQSELDDLERRCREDIDAMAARAGNDPEIQAISVAPRKSVLEVARLMVGWMARPRAG